MLEALCGAGWVGHVLGGEYDEQTVAPFVFGCDLKDPVVSLGAGVAEDVYRVAVAPVGRQEAVQALHRLRGGLGKLAAVGD